MNPVSTSTWRFAALIWLGVVLYLTLLPFNFGDMSLADAWARYQNIRFDGSGPRARQQWMSNLLMFVPLGFFWAGWWLHRVSRAWVQLAGAVLVMGFCLLVTATVEFLQFWIPNRGPSLTDISANATGGVVGAVAWLVSRIPAVREAARGFIHRRHGLGPWMAAYVAVYVFASLLPVDLVLSSREFSTKLASDHWGLWLAPGGCWWGVQCVTLRALEVLLMVPVGMWVAWRLAGPPQHRLLLAGAAGALVGLAVELGQFLTVSGVSEGASVLLRASGGLLGAAFWLSRHRVPWPWVQANVRPLVLFCLPFYLAGVALLSLAGAEGWASWQGARAQFESMRWLPLYHHYFVAEAVAIQNVLLHLGMYAVAGAGLWFWDRDGLEVAISGRPAMLMRAGVIAAALAVILEVGKLFLVGLRPDTTVPLLAALSAAGAYGALWWGLDGVRWRV